MYKKVGFKYKKNGNTNDSIVETVLLKGYPFNDVVERFETPGSVVLKFSVNKFDLKDLRHDVEVLQKAGLQVEEIEP